MASKPLPLRQHPWHQENLIWYATEADGALGRKSLQGAIQARLEGNAGCFASTDLLEDPEQALAEIVDRVSFRAAGRVKRVEQALARISPEYQQYLAAVYMVPPQIGLEAWDFLANMVVFSSVARKAYAQSRTKMAFVEWVVRLSNRRLGILGRDSRRAPPKATRFEVSLVLKIARECEDLLSDALAKYVDSVRIVEAGSLVDRILRRQGRKYGT